MWRTVIVNNGEKLTIKDNHLVVYSDNYEAKIPVEDIYALVIDNRSALLSVSVITTLTLCNAHIFYCDEKHIPVALSLPLNAHFKPFGVLKKQVNMPDRLKNELWQRIIIQKIKNQYQCLKIVGVEKDKREAVNKLSDSVLPGDSTNREAVAAKKYFSALFGSVFKRHNDDITNASLNYGYTIIRSAVCKTLTAYGFNCALGIHHINDSDAFNLAEDIMEPLRPLVDLWTDENCDELIDELTKSNRKDLISLVNQPILFDNKKMRVRYAIDLYVKSLVSAINNNNPSLLKIPVLLPLDDFFEDENDD